MDGGIGGFSLGIKIERSEEVDEIITEVERAEPEENYWKAIYLKNGVPAQRS